MIDELGWFGYPDIFEIIFNSLPEPVLVLNTDFVVTGVNQAGIVFLGFQPAGLTGEQLFRRLSCDGPMTNPWENIRDSITSGEAVQYLPFFIRMPDGTGRNMRCSAVPLRQRGSITGTLFVWNNGDTDPGSRKSGKPDRRKQVPDRKNTAMIGKDNLLKQQSEVFEKLFSNSHFMVVLMNPAFTIIRVNASFAELNKRGSGEFIGKNYFELFPDAETKNVFENVVAEGVPFTAYSRPISYPYESDGEIRYCDLSINPVNDGRDNVNGLILILLDVSMRKRAEMALVGAQRLAEIGKLAAIVGHELRNPLGVIQATVYNIRQKNTDAQLVPRLDKIERKIAESEKIINNLLNYARISKPVRKRIKFYNLIAECVNDCRNDYRNTSIGIVPDFESLKNLILDADPFQIREVLVNIINNAYQSFNGPEGTIHIKGAVDRARVELQVIDTGSGIEQADLDSIYDPFFTRKSKGTGLGLTICREMLGLHGGAIHINSAPGKGTAVKISLPLSAGE
ncbi:MAG: PAS domain-containing protein [Spirochaetales bacterium]|nr:PAS domain-containing protein [Spirochaetales bacterium]